MHVSSAFTSTHKESKLFHILDYEGFKSEGSFPAMYKMKWDEINKPPVNNLNK